MNIDVGEETYTKNPNILEEMAYRDTWGKGADSFIAMIYERLALMRDLLSENGCIYVHCDWRVNGLIRMVLDEIFGKLRIINEIAWCYKSGGVGKNEFAKKHDTIYFYSKSREYIFNQEKEKSYGQTGGGQGGKVEYFRDERGTFSWASIKDWWEISMLSTTHSERIGYPTQKPEALIQRVIKASTNQGDLVADFFCGSGTTAAVAEKLGRKWVVADLGKFAIHTTRKRMIGVQRQLKDEGKDYRAFEILNLGRYERSHYIGVNPNLREEEQQAQLRQKEADFLALILKAYQAEPVSGFGCFQGKRAGRLVAIGPINLPISRLFVEEIILECRKQHITKVDLLGFEFEMGLFPNVLDDARSKGIDIAPKYIPADVFDKRAVDRNQVVFHDVAYIEAKPIIKGNTLAVQLTDFTVFYSQDSSAYTGTGLGGRGRSTTRIVVEKGQIVKLSKDNRGETQRQVLTEHWTDWIDYWAVDFNYESKREIIRVPVEKVDASEAEATAEPSDQAANAYEERWMGDYIFENEWQSFRTRRDRSLELTTVAHDVSPGRRKVAVKVVDIFGNDTMAILDVTI